MIDAKTADSERGVAFGVLGPLRVTRGGVVVALCGRQQGDSRLSVEHLADVCAEPDRGRRLGPGRDH